VDDLPIARLDGVEREIRLLVDHREDLVAERTRIIARLRWHLHELDPGWTAPAKLERHSAFDKVEAHLSDHNDGAMVRRLALRLVDTCGCSPTRSTNSPPRSPPESPRLPRRCWPSWAAGH
jgi:hypothetical protein